MKMKKEFRIFLYSLVSSALSPSDDDDSFSLANPRMKSHSFLVTRETLSRDCFRT